MANMSYCRFQNTSTDLRDCADALEEYLDGFEDSDGLSREEFCAAKRLILKCQDIILLVKERAGIAEDEELTEKHITDALTLDKEES